MRKWIVVSFLLVTLSGFPVKLNAQAEELAQLALNLEKLAQFKQILDDLKKGYEILSGGYNTIKNLSKGNFELHKMFLDGLNDVSPAVKNYHRVSEIIQLQMKILRDNSKAIQKLSTAGRFSTAELDYLSQVHDGVLNETLENLEDLLTVITASKLRMSDDERLSAIDKIFVAMEDKLMFLKRYNSQALILSFQRHKEFTETKELKKLNGLN